MAFYEALWLVFWERTTSSSSTFFGDQRYVEYYWAVSTDGMNFSSPSGLQFLDIAPSCRPRVAANHTHFILVFANSIGGDFTRLVFSSTEHGGFNWTSPVDITDSSNATIYRYDVASDGVNFFVAYVNSYTGSSGTNQNIIAYRPNNASPWVHQELDPLVATQTKLWTHPRIVYDRTIGFLHCNCFYLQISPPYTGVQCAILPNNASTWNIIEFAQEIPEAVDFFKPVLDLNCNNRGVCVLAASLGNAYKQVYYWRYENGTWSNYTRLELDPSISPDPFVNYVTVSSDVNERWVIAFQAYSKSLKWGNDGDIVMSMSFDNAKTFTPALPQLPHAEEDNGPMNNETSIASFLEEYPQLASNGKHWLLVYTTDDVNVTGLNVTKKRFQFSFAKINRVTANPIPPVNWPICTQPLLYSFTSPSHLGGRCAQQRDQY